MMDAIQVSCACGRTKLEVLGAPIVVTECLCESCRAAAARLATLPGARSLLTHYGATPTAEFRKDRVRVVAGASTLGVFRLTPQSKSRRVVASCCNTPMFLDMHGAHWLSLYLQLWPDAKRPQVQLRTMTKDLAYPSHLPTDVPNLASHSLRFYAKLFAAWVAMGFRIPNIEVPGNIDA